MKNNKGSNGNDDERDTVRFINLILKALRLLDINRCQCIDVSMYLFYTMDRRRM